MMIKNTNDMETYEQILEDALNSKSTPFEVQRWIKEKFPSLKEESDDERTRKELIEYIKKTTCVNFIGKCSKKEAEKFISWLEKQSKDSPVFSNSSNIGKVEQKPIEDRYMEGYLNGINDASKTPKPAAWSEEDKEIIDYYQGKAEAYKEVLDLLDTLEVKEVDLNEYINKYFKGWYVDLTDQGNILHTPDGNAGLMSVKEVAKHFFGLGMAVSNKAQKGEEV